VQIWFEQEELVLGRGVIVFLVVVLMMRGQKLGKLASNLGEIINRM